MVPASLHRLPLPLQFQNPNRRKGKPHCTELLWAPPKMLSLLLPKSSHLRLLSALTSKSGPYPPILSRQDTILAFFTRHYSSSQDNNGGRDPKFADPWMFSKESDRCFNNIFKDEGEISERAAGNIGEGDDWMTADGSQMWKLGEEEAKDDMFDLGGDTEGALAEIKDDTSGVAGLHKEMTEEERMSLSKEAEDLAELVKGPNRAFGDLIAISGISDTMLDSLIALKDFQGIDGLPPLSVIEDIRYEKTTRKSVRAEIERLKQEEIAKSRVRKVDDKGRAYGTGRRKCSIARVWIEPGSGKFSVNDKEFDAYFPMLDNRATLLRPFVETKTLGLWDVTCTVKGGGTTGQVGAIRLGISRALQNWEPGLRPPLKKAGFLTRDPRVVERKKPGKAKARKSFQWVKR